MQDQYFSKFPKMMYDVTGSGNSVVVTDILHRAKFREVVKNNALIYYPYTVKDGETPEIVAHKLYDSAFFYWIVLFSNDIYFLWRDWPLSYEAFEAYLKKKYGSVDDSMTLVDHYESAEGYWIDETTYHATVADGSKIVYAYD
jgi:hypothetical protein